MAPVARQMFEWYATWRYSVREITLMAREHGLAFRKSGNAMPQSCVHKMLRNPIYMGDFAFTGLIRCGHCGFSMVAEIKKRRYVYFHCSRAKG